MKGVTDCYEHGEKNLKNAIVFWLAAAVTIIQKATRFAQISSGVDAF
jgi:hypothetical protein